MKSKLRNRGYTLVIVGNFVVLGAYFLLMLQDIHKSGVVPLSIALGGLAVATSGFLTFRKFEKEERFILRQESEETEG